MAEKAAVPIIAGLAPIGGEGRALRMLIYKRFIGVTTQPTTAMGHAMLTRDCLMLRRLPQPTTAM